MLQGNVYQKALAVAADFNGAPFNFPGGRIVLEGDGVFGAGTLKLQYTTDADITWVDLTTQDGNAKTLTAAGLVTLFLPAIRLRVVLAGSAAPTLNWFVGQAGIA